ncbi:hypothetical protein KTQ42_14110|uniref:hypothetical protein n=1 Tax=Noviherbaspirillum sp. L7-7A TaxID=2850560 RepID=UPI001C2C2947|nr:hypothetical protein [Noviherbaspirillum sp. L7-7A]MBV0880443.1 hypothetical protein [Noviherbaspirillum sp. L7-7A]
MAESDAAATDTHMLRRNGEADTIQEAGDTVELAGTPGGIWSMPLHGVLKAGKALSF